MLKMGENSEKVCPCCGKTSVRNLSIVIVNLSLFISQDLIKLSLCGSTDKLYFLGSGMPLFFDYSWFIFCTLLVSYIIYGIYTTLHFLNGDICDNRDQIDPGYCGARWKTTISAGNQPFTDIDGYEKVCAIFLFLALFAMKIYFFRAARKKDNDIDSDYVTPSDYTIKISNLPKTIKPKEVIDIFENYNYEDGKKVEVQKINFAYYIGDFMDVANKLRLIRLKIAAEKKKAAEKRDEKLIESLSQERADLRKKLNEIKEKLKQEDQSGNFTGICYLTFKRQYDAQKVLDVWGISFLGTKIVKYVPCLKGLYKGKDQRIKGKIVGVTEPSSPLDIFWENLGTPFKILIRTRMLTYLLSIILLGFSFGAILLLKWGQVVYLRGKSSGNPYIRTFLSFAISFCITFINGILGFTLRKLSAGEKYETKTAYNIGVAVRIASVRL